MCFVIWKHGTLNVYQEMEVEQGWRESAQPGNSEGINTPVTSGLKAEDSLTFVYSADLRQDSCCEHALETTSRHPLTLPYLSLGWSVMKVWK